VHFQWKKAGSGVLDRPLRKKLDEKESAITRFSTLAHGKLPYPVGRYPEARYSLVEAYPFAFFSSGRFHGGLSNNGTEQHHYQRICHR